MSIINIKNIFYNQIRFNKYDTIEILLQIYLKIRFLIQKYTIVYYLFDSLNWQLTFLKNNVKWYLNYVLLMPLFLSFNYSKRIFF